MGTRFLYQNIDTHFNSTFNSGTHKTCTHNSGSHKYDHIFDPLKITIVAKYQNNGQVPYQ